VPRLIHKPYLIAALVSVALLVGCGSDDPPAPAAAAPTPEAEAETHDFEPGHAKAVRDYYGTPHSHSEEPAPEFGGETEADYHKPPHPARGEIGDTITLTGVNLGVRMRVTVTGVADPARRVVRRARDGRRFVAVRLRLRNTGIAIFESELREATLAGVRTSSGVRAGCSNGFDRDLRIDVDGSARGCILFELPRNRRAGELSLALEQVPAAAGGRWSLR